MSNVTDLQTILKVYYLPVKGTVEVYTDCYPLLLHNVIKASSNLKSQLMCAIDQQYH